MLNESEELNFYQVDLTSIDINCYEYMFQDGKKTCREMDLSREIERQISQFKIRDIKFYNCKLITKVYDNINIE